jgi:hypothetical protein
MVTLAPEFHVIVKDHMPHLRDLAMRRGVEHVAEPIAPRRRCRRGSARALPSTERA